MEDKTTDQIIVDYWAQNDLLHFHHTTLTGSPPNSLPFVSHVHSHYEIMQLLHGHIGYIIDGRHYEMRDGDVILIDRNKFHMIRLWDTQYERRVIEFGADILNLMPSFKSRLLASFKQSDNPDETCVISGAAETAEINGFFDVLEKEVSGAPTDSLDMTIHLNVLLLLLKLNEFRKNESRTFRQVEYNSVVDAAVEYIQKNLDKKITLDDLSRELYISKHYLSHIFKHNMGTSVMTFVNIKKMQYAEELIAGGLSPTTVSLMLGYKSYSNFFNHFRKILGVCPKTIRS